jgi:hypothetical protein
VRLAAVLNLKAMTARRCRRSLSEAAAGSVPQSVRARLGPPLNGFSFELGRNLRFSRRPLAPGGFACDCLSDVHMVRIPFPFRALARSSTASHACERMRLAGVADELFLAGSQVSFGPAQAIYAAWQVMCELQARSALARG